MKHRLLLFSREVRSDLATPWTAARVASTGWKAAKEVVGRWMLREFHRAEIIFQLFHMPKGMVQSQLEEHDTVKSG